jgi:hypothetical protein
MPTDFDQRSMQYSRPPPGRLADFDENMTGQEDHSFDPTEIERVLATMGDGAIIPGVPGLREGEVSRLDVQLLRIAC